MTGQGVLFAVVAAPQLTERQRAAYDLVRSTVGGVTADEVGARLHALKGRHPDDVRCQWCAREGLSVLRSVAVAPLVVRRRVSGRYEPRNPPDKPQEPSAQLADLPGESFEDIFGGAA